MGSRPGLGAIDFAAEWVVLVLDDGTRVEGSVTISRRGSRLSDFLAQLERGFFTLADAKITSPNGEVEKVSFTLVARSFVRLVKPGTPPPDAPDVPDAA